MKKLISCIRIEWQQTDKKKSAKFLSLPVFQDRHTVQHISQKGDNGQYFEFDFAENMAKTRDITVRDDNAIVVSFQEPSYHFAKEVLDALIEAGYSKKDTWLICEDADKYRIAENEFFDENFLKEYATSLFTKGMA